MNPCAAKVLSGIAGVLIFVLTNSPLPAQDANAMLSGVVTDSFGKVVANTKVSIKNLSTSQSIETQSDSAGLYNVPNLASGVYEVSASVEGVGAAMDKVTVAAGSPQTLNLALSPAAAGAPSELPNAPPPAAKLRRRSKTWASLQRSRKRMPRSRPCSTSAHTC